MTLPTVQTYTPGQVVDPSRSRLRQRIYAGILTSYTLTYTVDTTGSASYVINGKTVSWNFTVPPDDATSVAARGATTHNGLEEVLRLAHATSSTNVLTIAGRTSFDVFTVSSEFITAAGTNAVALDDTTPSKTDLELGVLVAREGEGAVRKLGATDTAVNIMGVSVEMPGSDLKPNTGRAADEDVYEREAIVDIGQEGEFPVRVESDVAVGDDVFVRLSATGDQIVGSGATSDLGNGAWLELTTGAVWSSDSYFDDQGRKIAMLTVNFP